MSLVAYGSSGESDSEEENPDAQPTSSSQTRPPTQLQRQDVAKPSTSNISQPTPSTSAMTLPDSAVDQISDEEDEPLRAHHSLSLPPPRLSATGNHTLSSTSSESTTGSSLLLGLPAPERTKSAVLTEEDELEDLVKPKAAEIALHEKPPPSKKRKGTVKITIPKLQNDSDDELEDKSNSRPATVAGSPSKGKSGLFSLLPPPKQSTVKEANRSLLPHTLRGPRPRPKPLQAPKPQPKPTVAAAPVPSSTKSLVTADSDSDDEAVDFFSLDSEPPRADHLAAPSPSAPVPPESQPFMGPSRPEPSLSQPYPDSYEYPVVQQDETPSYPEVEEAGALQHDQEFLKMQGKNNRTEVVDFIDFNAKDAMDHKEDLKYLSLEKSEQVSAEEEKQFSTEQKKKHQIQYLAFMAKKREVDLKNQWASQRASRRQTQSKYGF